MSATYLTTTAGKSFVVTATDSYDAMDQATRALEAKGCIVGRFSGSAKVSGKKATEAVASGATDLRVPAIATIANRKCLGALVGM